MFYSFILGCFIMCLHDCVTHDVFSVVVYVPICFIILCWDNSTRQFIFYSFYNLIKKWLATYTCILHTCNKITSMTNKDVKFHLITKDEKM